METGRIFDPGPPRKGDKNRGRGGINGIDSGGRGAPKQGETKGITGGVVWMAVDERGSHKFTAARSSRLATESSIAAAYNFDERVCKLPTFPNHVISFPPLPQHDLWNGKFSVRFHGKSFPGHRKKLDRYPEKYPRYIMASIHPSESFLNLNPWARIIVASARRFGRTLCPNEISSITEYRSRLPRISCPLLKGMNLIVPRFAKPVRNRRRLESLWISCLNRVPGIHGGGGGGLFPGRGTIYSVGCWNRWIEIVRSAIGRRAPTWKNILRSSCSGRGKRAGIKGEIFGEKELEGQAVTIERKERQTRVVLRNLASGGTLFVSGHKAATSIPWNARLCMRRLLPRMRRYGTGNVCSRLIEFPAPAKVWRSVWQGYIPVRIVRSCVNILSIRLNFEPHEFPTFELIFKLISIQIWYSLIFHYNIPF